MWTFFLAFEERIPHKVWATFLLIGCPRPDGQVGSAAVLIFRGRCLSRGTSTPFNATPSQE